MRVMHFYIHYSFITLLFLPKMNSSPIAGGRIVMQSEIVAYPYIVSLQEMQIVANVSIYSHFCGGSILSSNWLLTAAHCAWSKDLNKVVAVIGKHYLGNTDTTSQYAIDRSEFYNFQPFSFQNDIALLRLREQFIFKESEFIYGKLPTFGMKANRKNACKVIGYGADKSDGQIQQELHEASVYVISKKECRRKLGLIWAPKNTDNTICALGCNQDTCQGDSGGPLLCEYKGEYIIYGIISHGLQCNLRGMPSVYTVTIPYKNWVEKLINDKTYK